MTILIKQCWPTIPTLSTNRAINSHRSSMNTKKTMAYDVGNPVPGFIYCWQPISTDDAILFLSLSTQMVFINKITHPNVLHKHNNY